MPRVGKNPALRQTRPVGVRQNLYRGVCGRLIDTWVLARESWGGRLICQKMQII